MCGGEEGNRDIKFAVMILLMKKKLQLLRDTSHDSLNFQADLVNSAYTYLASHVAFI